MHEAQVQPRRLIKSGKQFRVMCKPSFTAKVIAPGGMLA